MTANDPTPAERGLPDEATPTFEVGCRVQECGDFVSIFYTSGDTGRVVNIDRDGDLWVIWDNPKDDAQGDHGWCIPRNNCKLIEAAPSAPAEGGDARAAVIRAALQTVIDAVGAYLPPDGISHDELIAKVIEATDNPEIVRAMK